jgi:hypothetical protein
VLPGLWAQLRQFLVLPLCCLMNFCKMKKCQLMLLSKIINKIIALRRPLCRPAPRAPLLHHPSWVPGRGHRRQPPQGLHGRGRNPWQPASPRQTARFTPSGPAATKRVSFSDPLVSSPSPPAPPRDGPGTIFLPGKEVFARPGPAASSQVPQTRYPSRQRAQPQRLDLWPLLLPAEARAQGEPCGHLRTPLATVRPVGCTPPTL